MHITLHIITITIHHPSIQAGGDDRYWLHHTHLRSTLHDVTAIQSTYALTIDICLYGLPLRALPRLYLAK